MKSLITFVFFFLSNFIFCQSISDSIILKKHIKEVRVLDTTNNLVSFTKYNTSGKIIYNSLDNFGGATNLKTSITKFYDDNGNSIKTISTHSNFPNPTIWLHEYDKKGNRTSVKDEMGNLIFQFFYDDSNFLIKKVSYENDEEEINKNKIRQIITYEKSVDGKKIISKIIGDFIKNRTNITYLDDNGNHIKIESYDGEKINFISSSIFEKNKLIKTIYDSGYGSNYIYNLLGLVIKKQNFKIENGIEILIGFEEFNYSNEGLLVSYIENTFSERNLRKYRYEYVFYN